MTGVGSCVLSDDGEGAAGVEDSSLHLQLEERQGTVELSDPAQCETELRNLLVLTNILCPTHTHVDTYKNMHTLTHSHMCTNTHTHTSCPDPLCVFSGLHHPTGQAPGC